MKKMKMEVLHGDMRMMMDHLKKKQLEQIVLLVVNMVIMILMVLNENIHIKQVYLVIKNNRKQKKQLQIMKGLQITLIINTYSLMEMKLIQKQWLKIGQGNLYSDTGIRFQLGLNFRDNFKRNCHFMARYCCPSAIQLKH